MSESKSSSFSFPLLVPMFLIFLTLKLCGVIDWSWWWVTAPLWMPLAIIVSIFGLAFVIVTLAWGLKGLVKLCSKKKSTSKYGRNY